MCVFYCINACAIFVARSTHDKPCLSLVLGCQKTTLSLSRRLLKSTCWSSWAPGLSADPTTWTALNLTRRKAYVLFLITHEVLDTEDAAHRWTRVLCSFLQTWIHIARKHPGEYIDYKFRTAAMGLFHHINCYEESGFIVVDLCAWKGWVLYNTRFTYIKATIQREVPALWSKHHYLTCVCLLIKNGTIYFCMVYFVIVVHCVYWYYY